MVCGIQRLPIGLYRARTAFSNSNILESDDAEKIGASSEAGLAKQGITSLTAYRHAILIFPEPVGGAISLGAGRCMRK